MSKMPNVNMQENQKHPVKNKSESTKQNTHNVHKTTLVDNEMKKVTPIINFLEMYDMYVISKYP